MGEFFEKLGRLNFWSLNPIFCILAFVVMPGYFEVLVMEYFTGFLLVLAIAFIIAYLATKIKEKFLYLYFGIVAFFKAPTLKALKVRLFKALFSVGSL